ncbi:MAG TPA: metallophosphoesterase [Hyphomicrobium sp.]
MITRRQFVQGFGVAVAGGFGCGGYALAEPWGTGVTRYRLSPRGWSAGLSLKLAILTDLHACEPWMGLDRIRSIVAHTNALEPDCVLLLGDYVSGEGMSRYSTPIAHKDWARALAGLSAPQGVHAVLGNHDWWDDAEVQRCRRGQPKAGLALEDAGIPVYENHSVRLKKDGQAFWLTGLGDQEAFFTGDGRRRWGKNIGVHDLKGALAQVVDDAPVILLVHEPDVFPQVPDRVALTVAGHTHGGQVRLLGYAPFVPSRYGDRYVYGHIVEEGRHLIVSGGLGCSGMPVRFGSPPEIVMIEISA